MRTALVLAALFAVVVLEPARTATTESSQIRASAKMQLLGDYRIDRNPTYQGAINAFGEPDKCTTVRFGDGVAVWHSLGFRLYATTLDYPGRGANACNTPEAYSINHVTVTGRRWHTSFGLRVGDSTTRLRRLYPRAVRHRGWNAGFWLVTARRRCLGECDTEFVTVPRLVARVQSGRVGALVFPVYAQGE